MRRKQWRKSAILYLVFAIAFSLAFPALSSHAADSLVFYGDNGYILTVDEPISPNVTTNQIEELSFSLEFTGTNALDETVEGDRVDNDDVTVIYEDTPVNNFTINNIKLDKPGAVDLDIDIQGKSSSYEGIDDTITITLNYFDIDTPQAKYFADFIDGKAIDAFDDRVALEFPKGTYITDSSNGGIAPDQKILFEVDGFKDSLNGTIDPRSGYTFLSNSFAISHDSSDVTTAEPSNPGYITINYGYQDLLNKSGMISSEVAMYNIAIVKYDTLNQKWVPMGGIVDSKKQTVMAPFDKFGTYAVVLNTKNYNDLNDWSKPYVMALAYKGIVEQESVNGYVYQGRLRTDLLENINRYDFTVMLTKGMNWAPINYKDGYFIDIDPDNPTTGVRQVNHLPINGTAAFNHTLTVNFSDGTLNKSIEVPIEKGDTSSEIAIKIKDKMRNDDTIVAEYDVTAYSSKVVMTALQKGPKSPTNWSMSSASTSGVVSLSTSDVTVTQDGNGTVPLQLSFTISASNVTTNTLKITFKDGTLITDDLEIQVGINKDDSTTVIAQKIENALRNNETISNNYIVSRNTATITLTAKDPDTTHFNTNGDFILQDEDASKNGVSGSLVIAIPGVDASTGQQESNFSHSEDYIMAAVVNGLLQGELDQNGNHKMNPESILSREEAAVFASRALKLKVGSYDSKDMDKINKDLNKLFPDAANISEWAKPYVHAVAKAKVMNGDEDGFRPEGTLKFNEACALIYKIMYQNKLFGK